MSCFTMTSAYWPARLGVLAALTPRAPWHIEHCCVASVPPRPTDSALPARAIARVSTTSVVRGPAFTSLPSLHADGTPAARQMASHRPLAVKSACTEGSQTKPTIREATVSATRAATQRISAPSHVHGRHRALGQERQLRDREAVVHDRERDHHPHPQREAVQQRRGVARVRGDAERERG